MMKRYKSLKDIDSDVEKVVKILQNSNISTYCKRDYTIQGAHIHISQKKL